MNQTKPASTIKVLGFAGSLRQGSYNRALLRAATELLPKGMELDIFDLSPIPLYNEDVRQQGYPEPVQRLRNRIAIADALLIATPEYNYSVPGVLKNAIDWASRPPEPPLNDKPLAIMGATTSSWGTVRAQLALRQICIFTNMHPLDKPEVLVARAKDKFDRAGRLTDVQTRDFLAQLLAALQDWTLRLSKTPAELGRA